MFQTSVGAMADGVSVAYLRPETAQVRPDLSNYNLFHPYSIPHIHFMFPN